MSTSEFRHCLLTIICIIHDCGVQLRKEKPCKDDIAYFLHDQDNLGYLCFKMLDRDIGLTRQTFTFLNFFSIMSEQQRYYDCTYCHPDEVVYKTYKNIFRDSSVINDLCSFHQEAIYDMDKFPEDGETGGYNLGLLKMCLLYDMVRRVLITMQVKIYPQEALEILGIKASDHADHLLSDRHGNISDRFLFDSNVKEMLKGNVYLFLANVKTLRGQKFIFRA